MSTPEGKVKTFIDSKMKKWFPNAVKYSPPGGRFGRAGFPDRVWFIRANASVSVVVAIEAKDDGKNPTELQDQMLRSLHECGVLAAVVRGKDLQRMEMIRDEVFRRIRLANAEPESSSLCTSENDD